MIVYKHVALLQLMESLRIRSNHRNILQLMESLRAARRREAAATWGGEDGGRCAPSGEEAGEAGGGGDETGEAVAFGGENGGSRFGLDDQCGRI
jgi:hypothetical protein